jgi:hypothetical protein
MLQRYAFNFCSHRPADHRARPLRQGIVIAHQSAMLHQPAERPLTSQPRGVVARPCATRTRSRRRSCNASAAPSASRLAAARSPRKLPSSKYSGEIAPAEPGDLPATPNAIARLVEQGSPRPPKSTPVVRSRTWPVVEGWGQHVLGRLVGIGACVPVSCDFASYGVRIGPSWHARPGAPPCSIHVRSPSARICLRDNRSGARRRLTSASTNRHTAMSASTMVDTVNAHTLTRRLVHDRTPPKGSSCRNRRRCVGMCSRYCLEYQRQQHHWQHLGHRRVGMSHSDLRPLRLIVSGAWSGMFTSHPHGLPGSAPATPVVTRRDFLVIQNRNNWKVRFWRISTHAAERVLGPTQGAWQSHERRRPWAWPSARARPVQLGRPSHCSHDGQDPAVHPVLRAGQPADAVRGAEHEEFGRVFG